LLRAHPELPQASWLLAEVMRGWAVRWARLRPQDNVRAAEAWRRGAGLDGGRAAGVGEPGASERRAAVTATLALDGTGQASLDGVGVSEGPFQSADGDHQLVVTRNGTLILAEWVTVVQGAVVRVAVPEVAACSREDLQRARGIEGTVVPSGVRCQAWVRVQELDVGAVKSDLMLTVCERDTCGAPVRWSVGLIADAPRPVGGPAKHWPRWATWALVGAGAIAATGTALAAAGAFRPTRGEPIFTTNGLHTTSVSPGLETIGR
jgi:hypothetical protein